MAEEQQYKGHRIELRPRESRDLRTSEAETQLRSNSEPDLIIDGNVVRYGRLPDGQYYLHDFAYDWHHDLIGLAQKFIDYGERP